MSVTGDGETYTNNGTTGTFTGKAKFTIYLLEGVGSKKAPRPGVSWDDDLLDAPAMVQIIVNFAVGADVGPQFTFRFVSHLVIP